MFRLKANKTSLYKLVGTYEDLPPMRRVTITKTYRAPDWCLKWTDADGLLCMAFFSTCMGRPMLAIEKRVQRAAGFSRGSRPGGQGSAGAGHGREVHNGGGATPGGEEGGLWHGVNFYVQGKRNPDFKGGRWVVEVTHSFFNRFRKLLVCFEKKAKNHLALIHFACAIIVWRKLISVHC